MFNSNCCTFHHFQFYKVQGGGGKKKCQEKKIFQDYLRVIHLYNINRKVILIQRNVI